MLVSSLEGRGRVGVVKRDQLRGLCSEGGKGLLERVLVQVKVVDRDDGQDNCKLSMKRKDG